METKYGFTKMNLTEFENWITKLRVGRTILIIQQHHTWNPSYRLFTGSNHFAQQQGMKNTHKNVNGWQDIGQHFTTFPDGSILTGRSLELTPACLKGANTNGICIEHFGNFDNGGDTMTDVHKETIVKMTAILAKRFSVPVNSQKIVYHHWYRLDNGNRNNGAGGNKSCPGTNFFGGNKVADCEANFLPLVRQHLQNNVTDDDFTPTLLKYVAVNTALLNVRVKAMSEAALASDRQPLSLGSILRVYKEKDGWLKISDSKQHWVSGRLTIDVKRVKVTTSGGTLNVRSTPEIVQGNIVGKVSNGEEHFVDKEQNGWCKIVMEDRWISKQFLTFL
jgi:SH3-like domain-containing protein